MHTPEIIDMHRGVCDKMEKLIWSANLRVWSWFYGFFSGKGLNGKVPKVSDDLLAYYENMTKAILGTDEQLIQVIYHIDGLMQMRRNSSALAMELCLFCIKPSISSFDLNIVKWRL